MSALLVALIVVVFLLLALGAVLVLTTVMKSEVEKARVARNAHLKG
jgi:hypothetical protein